GGAPVSVKSGGRGGKRWVSKSLAGLLSSQQWFPKGDETMPNPAEQIATFFASNGATTIDRDRPGPYFETPIAGPLAETELETDAAYARLRAAEQLAAGGHHARMQVHAEPAVAFCRSVRATTYLRRAEPLAPTGSCKRRDREAV